MYEEPKLTTRTKDDCTGAQVYGRQSRPICETLFGKSTLLQEKKKKWRQSELIFHIQREARLISQNPLTLPTSPPLPLSFWKVRERQKHMTDSQEWQHIRNSFDV